MKQFTKAKIQTTAMCSAAALVSIKRARYLIARSRNYSGDDLQLSIKTEIWTKGIFWRTPGSLLSPVHPAINISELWLVLLCSDTSIPRPFILFFELSEGSGRFCIFPCFCACWNCSPVSLNLDLCMLLQRMGALQTTLDTAAST